MTHAAALVAQSTWDGAAGVSAAITLLLGLWFGALASAFVLGAAWALRGRPSLRAPVCRRCDSGLSRDAANDLGVCTECGAKLDGVGSVRWFRYRRQFLTLTVTLPVVLGCGLMLAGIVGALGAKALRDSIRRAGLAVHRDSAPVNDDLRLPQSAREDLVAALCATSQEELLTALEPLMANGRFGEWLGVDERPLVGELLDRIATELAASDTPAGLRPRLFASLEPIAQWFKDWRAWTEVEQRAVEAGLDGDLRWIGPRRSRSDQPLVVALLRPVSIAPAAGWRMQVESRFGRLGSDQLSSTTEEIYYTLQPPINEDVVRAEITVTIAPLFWTGQILAEFKRDLEVEIIDGPELLDPPDDPAVDPFADGASSVWRAIVSRAGERWLFLLNYGTASDRAGLAGSLIVTIDGLALTFELPTPGVATRRSFARLFEPRTRELPSSIELRYVPNPSDPPILMPVSDSPLDPRSRAMSRVIRGWWNKPAVLRMEPADEQRWGPDIVEFYPVAPSGQR